MTLTQMVQQVQNQTSGGTTSQAQAQKLNVHLGQPIAHILIEKKPKGAIGTRRMKLVLPTSASSPSAVSPAATSSSATSANPLTPLRPSASPAGSGAAATPHEFNFQTKPKSTMLVFGASVPPSAAQLSVAAAKTAANPTRPQPTPEAFRLEGEIALLADVQPRTNTSQYQAMLAARLADSLAKQRTTKSLDDAKDLPPGMIPLKRKADGFTASGRPAKVEKRVRMEADELERAVLELMSRPQFAAITIAKLSIELQQPLNAISDMVKKLCTRLEDGPNKGLYALRPEYQLATDQEVQPVPMEVSQPPSMARPQSMGNPMFTVKHEVKPEPR